MSEAPHYCAAHGWETWNDWYRTQWRPVMTWMASASGAEPGHVALDVACGTGQPAFLVAERVGAAGKVIAIDNDAEMLAAARRLAAAAGISNVELRASDMHDLRDVADASIDAATFGFALMFSPDPSRVLRELHRVLRPGGRLALAVWSAAADNAFLTSMFGAIAAVAPMPRPDPDGPGPFRFARPGELDGALRAAGFADVEVSPIRMTLEHPTRDQHWQCMLDMGAPLRRAVDAATPAGVARMRDALFGALPPGEPVRATATPLVATGVKR